MNRSIMLVEDEEADVLLIKLALAKSGFDVPVIVCGDGQEAIDYLSGNERFADRGAHPLPALILLDLNMPRVSGFGVLKWIREQPHLHLLVTILTSSGSEKDISAAYRFGANSYLIKPSAHEDLIEMIRDFANYWLKHNRSAESGA